MARYFTSLEEKGKRETILREQRRSVTAYDSDSSDDSDANDSSTFASSSASDGYDCYCNPKVDAASSEVDEDNELSAHINGHDGPVNARDCVDLTIPDDTQTDTVMEDSRTNNEEFSTVPQDTNDALHHLQLSKDLKSFLNDVIAMTMCPISHEQMINPYVAPDKYSYEKSVISEWLKTQRKSPLTRDFMEMFMLTQDHTMDRVIKSMKQCNITESVIQTLGTSEDTTSNTSGTTYSIHHLNQPNQQLMHLTIHYNISVREGKIPKS